MEKAKRPCCDREIKLDKILKKSFCGRATSDDSIINRIAAGAMAPMSVAYVRPECGKIIGVCQ